MSTITTLVIKMNLIIEIILTISVYTINVIMVREVLYDSEYSTELDLLKNYMLMFSIGIFYMILYYFLSNDLLSQLPPLFVLYIKIFFIMSVVAVMLEPFAIQGILMSGDKKKVENKFSFFIFNIIINLVFSLIDIIVYYRMYSLL